MSAAAAEEVVVGHTCVVAVGAAPAAGVAEEEERWELPPTAEREGEEAVAPEEMDLKEAMAPLEGEEVAGDLTREWELMVFPVGLAVWTRIPG